MDQKKEETTQKEKKEDRMRRAAAHAPVFETPDPDYDEGMPLFQEEQKSGKVCPIKKENHPQLDFIERIGHESPLPATLLYEPRWNHISVQDALWALPEEWKGWKFSLQEILDLTLILNEKGLWGHKRRPLSHDKIPSFEKEWRSKITLPFVKSLITPLPVEPHPFYPGGGGGWPQISDGILNLTVGCIIQRPKTDTDGRRELTARFPESGSAPLLQRTILTKTSIPFSTDVAKFLQAISSNVDDEIDAEVFRRVGESTSLHTLRMADIAAGVESILAKTLSVESAINHLTDGLTNPHHSRPTYLPIGPASSSTSQVGDTASAMRVYLSRVRGKVSNDELQWIIDNNSPLKRHRVAFQKILQDEIEARKSLGPSK